MGLKPRSLRRWAADARGTTAVEFALVGPLFIMLVFACIEFGVQLMTQMDLDNAAQSAARQIEIGQTTTQSAFTTAVCANASVLLSSCSSKLQVYVSAAPSFGALSPASVNSGGQLTSTGFNAGASGQAVLVQIAYTRPYDVAFLSKLFGDTPTLLSTVAVQNEPTATS